MQLQSAFLFFEKMTMDKKQLTTKKQAIWEGIIRTRVSFYTVVALEKVHGLMFSLKAKLQHLKDRHNFRHLSVPRCFEGEADL